MMRRMNWSNSGTVKAVSPCPGLQTIPFENIPMSGTHTVNAQRFVSKLVRHGASQVSIAELVAQGQII